MLPSHENNSLISVECECKFDARVDLIKDLTDFQKMSIWKLCSGNENALRWNYMYSLVSEHRRRTT